jgi:hypothetical protein
MILAPGNCVPIRKNHNGNACCGCKNHPLVNIQFIILLELGNRETRLVRASLPSLRCETHLVSACLLSSCTHTIYLFSPSSPTRGGAHQLLNPRQSKSFKDIRQLVLRTVLLALGPHSATGTHTCTYVFQWVPHVLAQGASREE